MRKPSKENLISWLIIAAIALLVCATFVLFFEKGVYWLGKVVRTLGVLSSPFIIAWLVAVITRPLTRLLVRKLHFPPSLAVLIMLLLLLVVVVLMVWLVVAVVGDVVADFSLYVHDVEVYTGKLLNYLSDIYERLELNDESLTKLFGRLEDMAGGLARQGLDVLFSTTVSVISGTPGVFIWVLVTLVATFYWCREEEVVRNALLRIFPRHRRVRVQRTYDSMSNVVGGYVRAQALLVFISICICIIGFTIIGAQSPLVMGLFTGVMDIIPILGPGTLIVPWAAWSLITGDFISGVGLIIIYATTTISRNILEPKIVGDRVGLHPLATLAAIFIGMRMFSLVGLILGPIVLAIGMAAWRSYRKGTLAAERTPSDAEARKPLEIGESPAKEQKEKTEKK